MASDDRMAPNEEESSNEWDTQSTSRSKTPNASFIEWPSDDELPYEFKRLSGTFLTRGFQEKFQSISYNNRNDTVFIASSHFGNKRLEGFLRKYDNITSLAGECSSGLDLGQSICKEVVITVSDLLVAVLHSGSLAVCDSDMNNYTRCLTQQDSFTAVCCDRFDGTRLISTWNSCTLRVFDLNSTQIIHKYSCGHAISLDFVLRSNSKFVTSGSEKYIQLWDLKLPNPCSRYGVFRSTPTAIQWSAVDENIFYVGTEFGELISFDARKSAMDLGNRKVCEKPINKIRCEANYIALLSNCEPGNQFAVLEEKSLNDLYFSTSSLDPICDFIFYDKNFYTVSVDGHIVIQHTPNFNTQIGPV